MTNAVLHPKTKAAIDQFLSRPNHAVLLTGPKGVGKGSVLNQITCQILSLDDSKLESAPGVHRVTGGGSIGIDAVRGIQHFLSLKSVDNASINRVVVIEDAGRLTTEAQNALLKSLEEPAPDVVIILSVSHAQQLLPTIRSRVQQIQVHTPDIDELRQHLEAKGYSKADADKALSLSGGLPGLTLALLADQTDHPLHEAVSWCRKLLAAPKFERLAMVDDLTKNKDLAIDVCEILIRMAHTMLKNAGTNPKQQQLWQNIMRQADISANALRRNGQPKLVLDSLLLHL